MVTAFILVHVHGRKARSVAQALLEFDGVKEVHLVAGEYDMVAVVRVSENADLSDLITHQIVHVAGVERTKTLFALDTFSNLDLASLFDVQ